MLTNTPTSVPEEPAGIRHCLTSNNYIVEIFRRTEDNKAICSTMFKVYTHSSTQTYIECPIPDCGRFVGQVCG